MLAPTSDKASFGLPTIKEFLLVLAGKGAVVFYQIEFHLYLADLALHQCCDHGLARSQDRCCCLLATELSTI
jgi:hypothetical protein